ncbi:proline-rich family protein [Arabidopsis thaliana]|uniref:Proline-rich family protein n=2 Tax=Arabidopsis TaxID=3701 RepID=F4IWT9_ARATH|nr:proline-rich family protein [Arabidopsis thaliana]AEE78524.1 proline-rich family protein [Arabidopsis thaliana]|eukprot:NP_566918.1 proline-rich family protein [Arabidopsis thaliana]
MLSKIKPVVLMSFLLLFPLCSSGFREGHGVTHTDQNSLNKVEESIPTIMDYPEPGPDPKHDPTKPGYGFPPPPPPPLSPPPPPKMN